MKRKTRVNFFQAVLGLIVAPGDTIELLLKNNNPRFGMGILVVFYLTLLVPVVVQAFSASVMLYNEKAFAAILIIPTITVVLFVFFEALFLRIFAIRVSLPKLTSSICYALMPLIGICWAMYILNYHASGSFAYLTIILNGFAAENPAYRHIAGWVVTIGFGLSFLVFFYAVRAFEDLYSVNALVITALSGIPLLAAFLTAAFAADLMLSGIKGAFRDMLQTPASMLGV